MFEIRKLAEKYGKPEEELQKKFLELKASGLSEVLAYRRLRGDLDRSRGTNLSPAVSYLVYIFGDTGVLDFVDLMRKKAIAMFNDPYRKQIAIDQGIITRDGIPLDTRKKVNFKDNPNYGRELPEEDSSVARTLFAIASKVGSGDYEFARINAQGRELAYSSVPLFTWKICRFNIGRRPDEGYLSLNASNAIGLRYEDPELTISKEPAKILREGLWKPITLPDIPDNWELYGQDEEGKKRNVPLLLEADIKEIREVSEIGDRQIILSDENSELDLMCMIKENFPIRFGLDSRVIFVGEIGRFRSTNEDMEGGYFFRAHGYVSVPESMLEI